MGTQAKKKRGLGKTIGPTLIRERVFRKSISRNRRGSILSTYINIPSTHIMDNQVFPFFELPLELRDRVYDYASAEVSIRRSMPPRPGIVGDDLLLSLRNLPATSILFANRQLSSEYKKQLAHTHDGKMSLTIIHPGEASIRWPFAIPREWRSKITDIVLYVPLICQQCEYHIPVASYDPEVEDDSEDEECEAACRLADLAFELDDRDLVGELTSLEAIDFKLATWWCCKNESFKWPETSHGPEMNDEFDNLIAYPKTRSCEVVLVGESHTYQTWYEGHRNLEPYATWTRGKGWEAGTATGAAKAFGDLNS